MFGVEAKDFPMFGVEARTSLFTFAIVLSDFFIALFVALVT